MTTPTIKEIETQQGAFVRDSGITIDVVEIYGYVTLSNADGTSIFLDGEAGSEFISAARRLWNYRGDINRSEANEIIAYPYADLMAEL